MKKNKYYLEETRREEFKYVFGLDPLACILIGLLTSIAFAIWI